MSGLEIRALAAAEAPAHVEDLALVLLDCVAGGASVGFLSPFSKAGAERYFQGVLAEVERGTRTLLAAFWNGQLVGTVQLIPAVQPNQPHRADVSKLLVLQAARGRRVATGLMTALEATARASGRTLLVLDTCAGTPAEKLYLSLGWTKAGVVPGYAMFPDGTWCDTCFFWKRLA